jgi:hypothetical protein
LFKYVWGSSLGADELAGLHLAHDSEVLLDARLGALTLHGGQILRLEVDDALGVALLVGFGEKVGHRVNEDGLSLRNRTVHYSIL